MDEEQKCWDRMIVSYLQTGYVPGQTGFYYAPARARVILAARKWRARLEEEDWSPRNRDVMQMMLDVLEAVAPEEKPSDRTDHASS